MCLLLLDDGRLDIRVSQELIDHWHEQYEELHSKLRQTDPDRKKSVHGWAALDNIDDMKSRMLDMLSAINDSLMSRGYTAISRNNFEDLRDWIRSRVQEWRQWREDRNGIIPQIGKGSLDESMPADKTFDHQFLALVLERSKVLVDDPDWARSECPWKFRSYRWESLLFTPQQGGYKTVDFKADISSDLIGDENVDTSSSPSDQYSSFRDLLQAAVKWIDCQESPVVLELFVPTELLVFDWSVIKVPGRSEYDDDVDFFKRYPYVLRSAERFTDQKLTSQFPQLALKYQALKNGEGCWIVGVDALDHDKLQESEMKTDLSPSSAFRRSIPSHYRVFAGIGVWWRPWCHLPFGGDGPYSGSEEERKEHEKNLEKHLDLAYKGLLSVHNDSNQVQQACQHLEELASPAPQCDQRSLYEGPCAIARSSRSASLAVRQGPGSTTRPLRLTHRMTTPSEPLTPWGPFTNNRSPRRDCD